MKTIISIFLLLFSVTITLGQESKIRFGKISAADLAMKVYPPDTEAVAVILSKIGQVKYDVLAENFPLTTSIHVVIKFLKEPALNDYGNVYLNYYSYNNNSKIGNIKAMVHLPDGTDVKVDNSQIMDEKKNDYYSVKKIALPKLVPGAIAEYQYDIFSSDIFMPVDWFFQSEIPIAYTELTTSIPDWFDYVVLTQGSSLLRNTQDLVTKQISLNGSNRVTTGYVTKSEAVHENADVKFNQYTFINKKVPALKEEDFITSMENYYSRIRFRLNLIRIPGKPAEAVMNTWSKVAEKLYSKPEWGGQIKNKRPGQLVLESAGINVSSSANQAEIASKLYDFVNNHIQWNELYSYGDDHVISDILKTGSGSSGDMNKLICAGLIQAGIGARPVLISTRDNGKLFEIYPFVEQFNHMVVVATLDGKETWIDAGNKFRPIGTLRAQSLNGRGWIVDETNPVWVDIKPVDSKTVYLIKGSIDENGNLNGDLESRFTGYHAVQHRSYADDEKEKYGSDLLVSGNNPLKFTGMELINASDVTLPFQWKAKIVDYPVATATAERIYISPVIPDGLDRNPFKLENRTYPIEINYPSDVTMIMDYSIPKGYKIEYIPEPIRYVTEGGGIAVTYNVAENAGRLNINMKYAVKQVYFDPEEYLSLKGIFNKRQLKFDEQIILIREQ